MRPALKPWALAGALIAMLMGAAVLLDVFVRPPTVQYRLPGGAVLAPRTNWSGLYSPVYLWIGAERVLDEPVETVCDNGEAMAIVTERLPISFYVFVYETGELINQMSPRYRAIRRETGLTDTPPGHFADRSVCNIGARMLLYGDPAGDDYPDFGG